MPPINEKKRKQVRFADDNSAELRAGRTGPLPEQANHQPAPESWSYLSALSEHLSSTMDSCRGWFNPALDPGEKMSQSAAPSGSQLPGAPGSSVARPSRPAQRVLKKGRVPRRSLRIGERQLVDVAMPDAPETAPQRPEEERPWLPPRWRPGANAAKPRFASIDDEDAGGLWRLVLPLYKTIGMAEEDLANGIRDLALSEYQIRAQEHKKLLAELAAAKGHGQPEGPSSNRRRPAFSKSPEQFLHEARLSKTDGDYSAVVGSETITGERLEREKDVADQRELPTKAAAKHGKYAQRPNKPVAREVLNKAEAEAKTLDQRSFKPVTQTVLKKIEAERENLHQRPSKSITPVTLEKAEAAPKDLQQQPAKPATQEPIKKVEAEQEKPPQPLVKPVTQEHQRKVQDFMQVRDPATFVDDTQRLNRGDMGTLIPQGHGDRPEGWLNDSIVNEYLAKVVQAELKKQGYQKKKGQTPKVHAFGSQFFSTLNQKGFGGVKRWFDRAELTGDKLLNCDVILIPICPGNHWTLLAISGTNRTIQYFNSMTGYGSEDFYPREAKKILAQHLGDSYNESEWKILSPRESNQQINGSDCGVFTAMNGHALLTGRTPMSVFSMNNGQEIQEARNYMAALLLGQEIQE
ncbi:MAG: hypothetical protein Q9159_007418 [Coniocarpon cinnabarinum]